MNDIWLSSYSPGLVANESLEAVLVQREQLISSIVRKCERGFRSQKKIHTLLIGESGIGKTFTLSLICSRLNKLENDALLVTRLNEEAWGITSYLDLVHRICSLLPGFSREDLTQGLALFKLGSDIAEKALERALSEFIEGKKIILVIENLDHVFTEIGKEGQKKLRAFLQNYGSITLLASARQVFPDIAEYTAPFYGFFELQHLKWFSFEEAQEFLWKLAILNGNQNAQLLLQSAEGVGKVKTIHYLAGGNPRVFMHFYDVLANDSVQSFINPLVKVLDELMPSYQNKMLQLSSQQRKIIEALADSPSPLSVKAIADGILITQQSTSSQLRDLKLKQIVESNTIGRESYYDLKDPLFKLCIQLKSNKIQFVNGLLSLLEAWFSSNDLQKTFAQIQDEDAPLLFKSLVEQYSRQELGSQNFKWLNNEVNDFSKTPEIENDLSNLQQFIEDNNWSDTLLLLQELLEKAPAHPQLLKVKGMASFALGRLNEALQSLEPFSSGDEDDVLIILAHTYAQIGRYEDAIVIFNRLLSINPRNEEALLGLSKSFLGNQSYKEAIRSAKKLLELNEKNKEALVIIAECFIDLEQKKEGLEYLTLAKEISPHSHEIRFLESKIANLEGNFSDALQILQEVISESEHNEIKAVAYSKQGWIFLSKKEDFLAARAFIQAIRMDKDCQLYWLWLGQTLEETQHIRIALGCYNKILESNKKYVMALRQKAICHAKLSEFDKALKAFNELKTLADGPDVVHDIAITYLHQGNFSAALKQLLSLPKGYKSFSVARSKALCLIQLGRPKDAEKIVESMTSEESKSSSVLPLKAMIAAAKGEWRLACDFARPQAATDQSCFLVLIDSLQRLNLQDEALTVINDNLDSFFSVDLLIKKGWLQCLLLRFEESKKTFEQALKMAPLSTQAFAGCFAACIQGHSYSAALKHFQKRKKLQFFTDAEQKVMSDCLLASATIVFDDEDVRLLSKCIEDLERAGLPEDQTIATKIVLLVHTSGIQVAVNKAISKLRLLRQNQIEQISNRFLLNVIIYEDKSEALAPFVAALSAMGMISEFGSACLKMILGWLENIEDVGRALRCIQKMTEICETYGIEMERPLKICRTIIEFIQTNDDKLLAQIPIEERSLVERWVNQHPQAKALPDIF